MFGKKVSLLFSQAAGPRLKSGALTFLKLPLHASAVGTRHAVSLQLRQRQNESALVDCTG